MMAIGSHTAPRVEAGVLPALAQLSSLTVSNFSATIVGDPGTLSCGAGVIPVDYGVDYNDPAGGMIPAQARIRLFVNGILDLDTALLASDVSSGDQFSGRLLLPFCFNFAGTSAVTITIQLVNSTDTVSNSLSALLTNPGPLVTTADEPGQPTGTRRA